MNLSKLWKILITVFLKCAEKDNFQDLTILMPNSFLTVGVSTKELPIRIQFVPLEKQFSVFSSSNWFCQK